VRWPLSGISGEYSLLGSHCMFGGAAGVGGQLTISDGGATHGMTLGNSATISERAFMSSEPRRNQPAMAQNTHCVSVSGRPWARRLKRIERKSEGRKPDQHECTLMKFLILAAPLPVFCCGPVNRQLSGQVHARATKNISFNRAVFFEGHFRTNHLCRVC